MPADAVIPVDVGNNTYAFGHYFETSGDQDVLMSRYLGSIGFALPAAMAPGRPPRGRGRSGRSRETVAWVSTSPSSPRR